MLQIREATWEDIDLLFAWANDPVVRRQSFNQSPISYETHHKWFNRIMEDESVFQYILIDDTVPVGQVRLNVHNGEAEISYSVAEEFRNQGFGNVIVGLIVEWARNNIPTVHKLVAKVKTSNLVSMKVFEKQGFKSDYISYSFDLSGEEEK